MVIVGNFDQANMKHLREQIKPVVISVFLASSVGFDFVVVVFHDLAALAATQYIGQQAHAHALIGTYNGRKRLLCSEGTVKMLGRIFAHITIAATFIVRLSKVVQHRFTATNRRFGKLKHSLQFCQFQVFLHRAGVSLLEHFPIGKQVCITEKQERIGGQTIPTSPAYFLIISFQISRQIIMHHETHIAFVNAHAESKGSANNGGSVIDKILLCLASQSSWNLCVIMCGTKALCV